LLSRESLVECQGVFATAGRMLLIVHCYALLRMGPLSISYARSFRVISCGKVDYDKFS
jgi:hypothetical protein